MNNKCYFGNSLPKQKRHFAAQQLKRDIYNIIIYHTWKKYNAKCFSVKSALYRQSITICDTIDIYQEMQLGYWQYHNFLCFQSTKEVMQAYWWIWNRRALKIGVFAYGKAFTFNITGAKHYLREDCSRSILPPNQRWARQRPWHHFKRNSVAPSQHRNWFIWLRV